jgi:hypothetical protein
MKSPLCTSFGLLVLATLTGSLHFSAQASSSRFSLATVTKSFCEAASYARGFVMPSTYEALKRADAFTDARLRFEYNLAERFFLLDIGQTLNITAEESLRTAELESDSAEQLPEGQGIYKVGYNLENLRRVARDLRTGLIIWPTTEGIHIRMPVKGISSSNKKFEIVVPIADQPLHTYRIFAPPHPFPVINVYIDVLQELTLGWATPMVRPVVNKITDKFLQIYDPGLARRIENDQRERARISLIAVNETVFKNAYPKILKPLDDMARFALFTQREGLNQYGYYVVDQDEGHFAFRGRFRVGGLRTATVVGGEIVVKVSHGIVNVMLTTDEGLKSNLQIPLLEFIQPNELISPDFLLEILRRAQTLPVPKKQS